MGDYKEDTNQDSGTIFFIILFSIFVLASSGSTGSHSSSSVRYYPQEELLSGNISSHFNATINRVVCLPVVQKYCECTHHNSNLNLFSIPDKISEYNRRTAQNFILVQKVKLSIEPVLPLWLYLHHPSNKDDDLPVLS
jgi:hypothetical protein